MWLILTEEITPYTPYLLTDQLTNFCDWSFIQWKLMRPAIIFQKSNAARQWKRLHISILNHPDAKHPHQDDNCPCKQLAALQLWTTNWQRSDVGQRVQNDLTEFSCCRCATSSHKLTRVSSLFSQELVDALCSSLESDFHTSMDPQRSVFTLISYEASGILVMATRFGHFTSQPRSTETNVIIGIHSKERK